MDFKKAIMTFILAALPISEVRGAIPYGIGQGLSHSHAIIIGIVGNIIIVPILLLIVEPLFHYFKSFDKFRHWVNGYEARAAGKMKNYRKYRLLGLFLLVAVPFPTTGAYTGVVAAKVLNIRDDHAFFAIAAGVAVAGTITYYATIHAINFLGLS